MQTEYNVVTISVLFIKVTGTSAHNGDIQTPISMLMIKCSKEEVRKYMRGLSLNPPTQDDQHEQLETTDCYKGLTWGPPFSVNLACPVSRLSCMQVNARHTRSDVVLFTVISVSSFTTR